MINFRSFFYTIGILSPFRGTNFDRSITLDQIWIDQRVEPKKERKEEKETGKGKRTKGVITLHERKWQFTFLVARLKPLFVGRRSRCSVHPHKWPDIFRVGTCVAIGNGHELVRCNGTARATTSATTQRVSGACMHHWRNKYVERGR